jgi:2-oxoglutarate-dependent dioxygenase
MMATAPVPDPVQPLHLAEQDITRYREEGYLLLPGLLGGQDAAALYDEVLAIMDAIGLPLTKLRQTTEYLAGSRLDAFVNSPRLLALAAQLMEGPSTLYMPFTAVKSARGGGRFHFHQDNQYTRFDGPGLNLWTALSPMTPDTGCLQVIPRSHLQGTLESELSGDGDQHKKITWEPTDFLPLVMRPGDCVAFSRLTVHGSGANTAETPRVAYAVQFHRNDVRALQGDAWQLLTEFPRWNVRPVDAFSVPAEKQEAH